MSVCAEKAPVDSPSPSRAKALILCGGAVVMLGLLGALAYPDLRKIMSARPKQEGSTEAAVGCIVSAQGSVSLRRRNKAAWTYARSGMQLCEGDMLQTGGTGSITIRYSDAVVVSLPPDTVFSVDHNASTPAPQAAPRAAARREPAKPPLLAKPPVSAEQPESMPRASIPDREPALELERIIAFGRTLEVIGHVDPGSSVYINEESVDISGSGSFKHFTKPFPSGSTHVDLILRVVDLRGRVRTLYSSYSFGPDPGEQ